MRSNSSRRSLSQRTPIDWVILSLVVALPFSGKSVAIGMVPVPVTDLLLLTVGAFVGVAILLDGQVLVTKSELGVFAAFTTTILLFTLSTVFNGSPMRPVVTQLGRLFVLGVLVLYVTTLDRARWVLFASFVVAVLISILTVASSVLHLPIGQPFIRSRQLGPISIPFRRTLGVNLAYGIYGMYVLTATPYVSLLAIERRDWLLSAGVGIVIAGIVVGQSRSTWIAAMVAFGLLGVYVVAQSITSGGRLRRYLAGFGLITGGLLSVPLAVLLTRLFIAINKSTFSARLEQYRAAAVGIATNPFFGIGTETFQTRYGLEHATHNAFLRFGVDTGVFGFFFVTSVFVYTTLTVGRYAVQIRGRCQRYAVGVLAGLLAVIVEASFQTSFGRAAWVAVALGVSSTAVCNRRTEREEQV